METALLKQLNTARAERRTCMLVTDLASGGAGLVFPDSEHQYPDLVQAISAHFAAGRSGEVAVDTGRYFLNTYVPPLRLVLIGAVHIAQALVVMADTLGYETVIIDPRTLFASEDRFPATRLIAEWPRVALAGLAIDRATACVTLTHDPKLDDDALRVILASNCFFVGSLGSRKTHAKRVSRLLEAGISQQDIDRIRAPVGLNIGALSPEEIAVSIIAEIVATWRADRVAEKARK